MHIEEVGPGGLAHYATIPMAFEVTSILRVKPIQNGLGGLGLSEEPVATPYIKNYDAQEDGDPQILPERFGVENWGFFLAVDNNKPVGGAIVTHNTSGVNLLEDRNDLAILWDLRIHPNAKRQNIGTQLFAHCANWARKQNCSQLKIETQNINIPACHFYAKQGCQLVQIDQYAYQNTPDVAHEIMLVWYYNL
jgi:GNAT superfamily N-acetyltransferase